MVRLLSLHHYFLLVRGRGGPPLIGIPAFLGSLAAAGRVLPASRRQFLHGFEWIAIRLELIVVGLVVVKARQVARRMRAEGPADPGTLFASRHEGSC